MKSLHVLVLNYNGADILEETLPTLVAACAASARPCRLTVIDNSSADASLQILRGHFPSVNVIKRPNRVLCSYNDVCRGLSEDLVVLMNNDVKVRADFLNPLADLFDANPDLFMAAPKCMDYDGARVMGGVARARFKGGLMWVSDERGGSARAGVEETLTAGPAAMVDRLRFLELGGFDELYLPGTFEDVDLNFRAWLHGWRALYEPKSVVYHKGQHSFRKKFGGRGIARVNARNNFLFVWKNIRDRGMRREHALWVLPRLLYHALRGQWYWIPAYREAVRRFREIGRPDDGLRLRSEREVLAKFSGDAP